MLKRLEGRRYHRMWGYVEDVRITIFGGKKSPTPLYGRMGLHYNEMDVFIYLYVYYEMNAHIFYEHQLFFT